jgi:polysaccharide chain length determinant protein (PEP-CTERM system associated)
MLGQRELIFEDYMAILRRRLWILLIPTILGPAIAFGVSYVLHKKYVSQTLVLIEQQKVPENYVKSVGAGDLTAQLATMQEQNLSRTRLVPIIEKYGLYRDEAGHLTTEDLVARLRKDIVVTPVRAMGSGSSDGFPGFNVSFTSDDPHVAQQVCAEITTMFMDQNLKSREQRAEGTTDFLTTQLADAKQKLDDQDAKLAEFKRHYMGQLPGEETGNLNILNSLNTQLDAANQALNRTEQDKAYVNSMITQQLATLQTVQQGNNPEDNQKELVALQNQLVLLESRYTEDHPDVVKAKNDIALLKQKLAETSPAPEAVHPPPAPTAESPAIQQLRGQLFLADRTIKEKTAEAARLKEEIRKYQARIQTSPNVEQQYKEITRDYQVALTFYNELLTKKNQSEMSTDLERRQGGEHFSVMDPASFPEKASFPNRSLFAMGGFGIGLSLGFGIVVLLEMRNKALYNERDIEFFLELPTLAMVPTLKVEGKRRWFQRGSSKPSAVTGAAA